jgi:hypothetical protein
VQAGGEQYCDRARCDDLHHETTPFRFRAQDAKPAATRSAAASSCANPSKKHARATLRQVLTFAKTARAIQTSQTARKPNERRDGCVSAPHRF